MTSLVQAHAAFKVNVFALEHAFYDAIFERGEGNGGASSSCAEERVRGDEAVVEFVEFVVDEDSKTHEALGGDVRATVQRVGCKNTGKIQKYYTP